MNDEDAKVEIKEGKVYINNVIYLEIRNLPKRILVVEDKFKSSYDCKTCEGKGKVVKICLVCDGSKMLMGVSCGRCDGTGELIVECKDCGGKGGILVIPEIAKAKPTSGKIACVGPGTHSSNVGDRVAYTGYTGHLVPFKGNTRIRVMLEDEIICFVGDVGDNDRKEEVYFVDMDQSIPTE